MFERWRIGREQLCDRWDGGVQSPQLLSGHVVKGGTDSQLLEMWEGKKCNWNVVVCGVNDRMRSKVLVTCEGYESSIFNFNCRCRKSTYMLWISQGQCQE